MYFHVITILKSQPLKEILKWSPALLASYIGIQEYRKCFQQKVTWSTVQPV